jgi:hypothetical protein
MPYIIATIFILLLIVGVYLKNPSVRGRCGEKKVRRIIGKTVEGKRYVINDIIFMHDGKTSQIDHIIINPRGVFVIETKNYSGKIYGSETQREWTQVLAYGNVKNKFYNPIKQNATHVYNVKKIVGKLPVYSLVVFAQNNAMELGIDNVIDLSKLRSVLRYGEDILTTEEMEKAYERLLSAKADITTKEHVKNIRKQQSDLEKGVCPRCGGELVLRDGKYGEFWGCSNYPNCKFILKD